MKTKTKIHIKTKKNCIVYHRHFNQVKLESRIGLGR